MLYQLIKKDLLMFWRRPRELIILLFMPFVLITILGFALGSFNNGEVPDLNIKLAIIQKDSPSDATSIMMTEMKGLPVEMQNALQEGFKQFQPTKILMEDVLQSDELKKIVSFDVYDGELSSKEEQKYSGTLIIPEHFTADFYKHLFLQKGEVPSLQLKLNESQSLEAGVLKDIIISFQEEMSLWTTVHSLGLDGETLRDEIGERIGARGEVKTVSKKKVIDSVTYYAIGMSVMFIFYVASNVSSFAYEQKEKGVYSRVILANVSNKMFYCSIFVSTFIVSFLQVNILFGLSAIFYDVTWPNISLYFVVTAALSTMVSSVAMLLSGISYRLQSEGASRVFSNFFVPVLAFMGGSFYPVSQIGGIFEYLSNYSPGGAGISAYFKVMQGFSFTDLYGQLISILVTTILLVICTMLIQPRRGETI